MAVVPSFNYDLFVSYAHKNDVPWKHGAHGWVTEFVETLRTELEAQSRDFRVWWDPELRTGDRFDDAIGRAISESATFLSVLSPAYNNCPYCKREVALFREQRHPAFGMTVGTLSRMQGIVLEDLASVYWPPEIRLTSPYRFHKAELRLNKPAEADEQHPYVIGVAKLRKSIWGVLETMRDQKEQGTAISPEYEIRPADTAEPLVVLLANVSDDLSPKRENLHKVLERVEGLQCVAWSDEKMPPSGHALSVHMFGPHPSQPSAEGAESLARLQLDAARAAHPIRRPLVWIPRGVTPDSVETPEHQEFLKQLRNDSRVELMQVGFEDLKDEILSRLPMARSAATQAFRRVRPDPIVHIWWSEDPTPIVPLKQCLKRRRCGISVFSNLSLADATIPGKLAFCDGLIVPYTHATKSWAEDAMMKAFQLRRREERPLAFAAVALPPRPEIDFNFDHPKVLTLTAQQDGEVDGIDQFLSRIEEHDA